jgi:hypothetical protein
VTNSLLFAVSGSSSEEIQQKEWLGDLVEGPVEKVTLKEGDTMCVLSEAVMNVH